MRRKAASLLLVAMMMSVAVPVHASEQATVTIQESQGENREVDQVQSWEYPKVCVNLQTDVR